MLAAHSDFDFSKIIVILIFLAVGFFQWLANLIKQKRQGLDRLKNPPPPRKPVAPAETEEAEEPWNQSPEIPARIPNEPRTEEPLEDLLEQLRSFSQKRQEAPPVIAAAIPVPPPLPAIKAKPAERPTLPAPAMGESSAPVTTHITTRERRHPIAQRLAATGGLRGAVILREVIGPPKALQGDNGSLN